MADSPVAAYIVKQSQRPVQAAAASPTATRRTASRSRRTRGLAKPVLAAVKALMANGTYKAILAKWGVRAGAITEPEDQRRDRAERATACVSVIAR